MFKIYLFIMGMVDEKVNINKYKKVFNSYYLNKLQKCNSKKTRQQVLSAALLLSYITEKYLDISLQKMKISLNKHGKPFFVNYSNIFFNISHSGKWVACAISKYPVGVDIQKIRKLNLMKLANRFFSQSEVSKIHELKSDLISDYFYSLWVLKESYLKATGTRLVFALNNISFQLAYNVNKKNFNEIIQLKCNKSNQFNYKLYNFNKNYKLALCVKCAKKVELPKFFQIINYRNKKFLW